MLKLQGQAVDERSPYWDNIKGFLISLVVVGHFLWDYRGMGFARFLVNFVYLFHMPAFIFVSGYLSKSDNSKSIKSIFKLVVTYIIFNTTMMIFSYVLVNTSIQLITPVYSFWFLISLIIWRLIIRYVEKIKDIIIISIIAAIFIGFWSDVTNVLAIARTVVFFPFFLIGYKLSPDKINHFINKRKSLDYLKGILLLLFTAYMSSLFIFKYSALSEADFLMQNYDSIADMFVRMIMLGIAGLMIMSIIFLTPKNQLRFLSKWGRNSLTIYILHRFFTLIFFKAFPINTFNENYIILAFSASVITLLVLGSDMISSKFNWMINKITDAFYFRDSSQNEYKRNIHRKISVILLIIYLLLPIITPMILPIKTIRATNNNSSHAMHKVMTNEQKSDLKDAVSIAFVGDLILLQDQVRKAYSNFSGEYEFDDMFEYASKYLTEVDLAIGIFEGPTAGEEAGYSTSNYDDGIPLYLNYPDSFAKAVKDSGIDLVSTANNHLLDKGEEGALRTLDILDEVGLLHVGSYRNDTERNSVVIIEKEGLRIAFLAYTFGSNGYSEEYFLRENTSLTSILAEPSSRYFKEVKAKVISDFQRVEAMENPPDLIAVLPHMGTQFMHDTDTYQDTWNDIFIQAGADIILGDHAHAVQPIEFRKATNDKGKEKQAVIVNCPGNFVNSYVEKDGDATSIVEVYIDPKTKEIIATGVIPMYTQAPSNGNYRALPIYSILNDPVLQNEISAYELGRVAEVQAIVSSVMLGTELTLDQAQARYYLFPEGYVRRPIEAIEITDEMKETDVYKLLSESQTICFVGDSITAGSENGGYGWYEPLVAAFPDRIVYKKAWASATTMTLLENTEAIAQHSADLYVIAIGTNDVRYRNKKTCAMDKASYVANINELIEKIQSKNPKADFALVSPWLALDNDPYTTISVEKRDLMLAEYGEALALYCKEKGYSFINPNPAIDEVLLKYAPSDFLIDHIHPNANAGITLYSEKVLVYNEK
ncbi:MAG TPA: CapA family protein [Patescibacteria group bacterium]|nr:CapA family protein [Patescibacteria group bacterium]